MRICYLANAGSVHFIRWYEYFINRGHEVYLISGDSSRLEYRIDVPGLKVFYLPERKLKNKILSVSINLIRLPFIYSKLKKILYEIKPDIVHAHQVHPYGFWAALTNFTPFIVTPIGSDVIIYAMRYRIYRKMAKYVFNKANIVTGDSLVLKKCCLKIGLKDDKYYLIQNGVNLSIFTPNKDGSEKLLRNKLGIPADAPIVFYARGFTPLYNVDKIIQAIPAVLKEIPSCKFLFARHFGYMDNILRGLVKKINVSDAVIFLGFIQHRDMPKFMKISNIFISVPSSDSSPSSIYEAMACGVPTIISKLPWTDYAMRHLQNTYMIDKINPQSISDAIIHLLTNSGLQRKIKRGGYETVKKHFCYHSNMKYMEKIMLQLVENHYASTSSKP